MPSAKPAAVWMPTTARSANSSSVRAPAYVHAERTPEQIPSSTSSTPGRCGSSSWRDDEMPSSNSALRARSKLAVAAGAGADRALATPSRTTPCTAARTRRAAGHPATRRCPPATSRSSRRTHRRPARARRRAGAGRRRRPRSARRGSRPAAAHSSTAENCGRPTPVIIRVVHIAPGPTPTLTMSAPAAARSRTPSAVTTLPATTGTASARRRRSPRRDRTARSASSIFSWWPCAVSTTSTSTPASSSAFALTATSPLMPTAAAVRSRPAVVDGGGVDPGAQRAERGEQAGEPAVGVETERDPARRRAPRTPRAARCRAAA